MNIGAAAQSAGAKQRLIRRAKRIGLHRAAGCRDFSGSGCARPSFIGARDVDVLLAEIEQPLELRRDRERASDDVRALSLARAAELKREEASLERWAGLPKVPRSAVPGVSGHTARPSKSRRREEMSLFSGACGLHRSSSGRIGRAMRSRLLLACLLALAMLFAPLGMQSGSAMAMTAGEHQAQMLASGHCSDQPSSGKGGKLPGKSCCAAPCTAVALNATAPAEPAMLHAAALPVPRDEAGPNFLAKLPTPPPRRA